MILRQLLLKAVFGQRTAQTFRLKIEVLLQPVKHRHQIGRLRESIRPAPLQGFQHRGGDAHFSGQIPQAQAALFSMLPQAPPGFEQGIAIGGEVDSR